MDNQTWTYILGALSGGCGFLQQILLSQFLKWRAEDGQPASPKTKRRVSLLIAPALPSVLYAVAILAGWTTYELASHLLYMGLAFMSAQGLHGEMKLQTGAEVKAEERAEAYVGRIPQGHHPPVMPIAPSAPRFDDTDLSNSGDLFPDGQRGASGGM